MDAALQELQRMAQICQYEILRSFFTGTLQPQFAAEIDRVLQQQFKVDNFHEIGGSIFKKEDRLELRIVKSEITRGLDGALARFEHDNDDDARETLYQHALWVIGANGAYVDESNDDFRIMLGLAKYLLERKDSTPEKRAGILSFYKHYMLQTAYRFYDTELGMKEEGFLGMFHVHNDGSEPSPGDLKALQLNMISVVISAEPDYHQKGIALYVIHSGAPPDQGYETLYQGPLTPQKL